MAITFDAATDGGNTTATSLTFSHTVTNAHANLYLVVGVVGDLTSGADDITTVKYAGVSMTQIAKVTTGGSARNIYLYNLIAPATGANNVVISFTGSHYIAGISASYYNVGQNSQPDVSTTGFVNSGTFSLSVTTTIDNDWTLLFAKPDGGAPTASVGTQRVVQSSGTNSNATFSDSNAVVHPAGSSTLTDTSTSGEWSGVMIGFSPPVTLKTFTGSLTFSGAISNKAITTTKTGALTFSGSTTKFVNKSPLTGSLSFAGSMVKLPGKTLTAALTFSGSLSRQVGKKLFGVLTFIGTQTLVATLLRRFRPLTTRFLTGPNTTKFIN